MPLVVPGINSTDGDSTEDWMTKLVGKKLSDEESSSETVRYLHCPSSVFVCEGILLTCPSTGLRQARSSPGGTHYRAGNDGHKGLQREQTQRSRQG
jgi:hypothetical protein